MRAENELLWGFVGVVAYEVALLALLTGYIPAHWLRAVLP